MIWKLVKFYNTVNETIIKEFSSIAEATVLYDALNTESNNLSLEIYFEDLVYNNEKSCWDQCKFTSKNNNVKN